MPTRIAPASLHLNAAVGHGLTFTGTAGVRGAFCPPLCRLARAIALTFALTGVNAVAYPHAHLIPIDHVGAANAAADEGAGHAVRVASKAETGHLRELALEAARAADVKSSADGSASMAAQPSPAESPPVDLWERIRAGFAMPDLDDELVERWERFYAERPDYIARIVDRSSRYLFYIVTEIERRDMPLEIALLPMIESAFNPVALSSAKASGIWQFIPSTGSQFGMKQDWWADSRRDVVAATHGALEYLSKLYGMFNDWQLALASYNWGEGSVMRAVARARAAGRDGSYLSLNMPAETRNYLPKLQAVKNIIRDPARYGLRLKSIPNEPYFKTITLAHPIDVKRAVHLAQVSEEEFLALNPAHHRPVIGGRSEFQILLPAANADLFLTNLETDARPKVSWMAYRTRPGDRIDVLAERFGTTAAALRSVNGIRSPNPALPVGYHLLVPSDGPSDEALGSLQNAVFTKFPDLPSPGRLHRVRKGETLESIARRYRVTPATLAAWNRMTVRSGVRAGQTLRLSGPAPMSTAKSQRTKGSRTRASAYRSTGVTTGKTTLRAKQQAAKAKSGKARSANKRR